MSFLLDTNVLSELQKSKPDRNVLQWFDGAPASDLFVSVLVLGEIRRGVEGLRRKDRKRAAALDEWLSFLRGYFEDRILPVTAEVAEEWGRLGVPNPVPIVDGLLAATARVHGLTLVTRNTPDFERHRVPLLNPFSPL